MKAAMQYQDEHVGVGHVVNVEADPLKGWDDGLPRTCNPYSGTDDTELRKAQCEEVYKLRHYTTVDQVRHLRRQLYLSINHLRTNTSVGYQLDKFAIKTPYRAVLH